MSCMICFETTSHRECDTCNERVCKRCWRKYEDSKLKINTNIIILKTGPIIKSLLCISRDNKIECPVCRTIKESSKIMTRNYTKTSRKIYFDRVKNEMIEEMKNQNYSWATCNQFCKFISKNSSILFKEKTLKEEIEKNLREVEIHQPNLAKDVLFKLR